MQCIIGRNPFDQNSGLCFRHFRASKGTVFSTGLNWSRQNGGFTVRLVCHSSTISSKQPISILQNNNEIIITYYLLYEKRLQTILSSIIRDICLYDSVSFTIHHMKLQELYETYCPRRWK